MTMIILVGIPGAGKSTVAHALRDQFVHCSADHYFMNQEGIYTFDRAQLSKAHSACLRACIRAVQGGQSTCIDNTNLSIREIAPYMAIARAHDQGVEVWHVACDLATATARGIHDVPPSAVAAMQRRLEKLLGDWPRDWPRPLSADSATLIADVIPNL